MAEHTNLSPARAVAARWLGIGLASVISVIILGLAATDRLALYISPGAEWFTVSGAVVTLLLALWSCVLPLGAEADHGHNNDHGHDGSRSRRTLAGIGSLVAGAVASVVALLALVTPPASLSVDLAMARTTENTPLFAQADEVSLGATDTTKFGVGEWSRVFATSTRPETYDGSKVKLTGFITPSGTSEDSVNLTRLVITHCVIDAQPAAITVSAKPSTYSTGQWVEIDGTVRASEDGKLSVEPTTITEISEPKDPYEY